MTAVARLLDNCALAPDEVAQRSGLDPARVHEILSGARLTMQELRALSSGLKIPLYSFSRGVLATSRSEKIKALYRSGRQHDDFSPPVERIAEYVTSALRMLPEANHSKAWFCDFHANEMTYAEAHRLATQFRKAFYPDHPDAPVLDLPALLTRHGLAHLSLLSRSRIEGASVTMAGYAFIFLSPRFPGRMLFTLAHELGHVVAEHGEEGTAVFERSSQIGGLGRKRKNELFVDAFASALLMPDRGVGRFLHTIRRTLDISSASVGDIELLLLARYYGVSFDVAARRCEDLQLLPKGAAWAMSRQLRKEFGSAEKRAESAGLPARQEVRFPRISPQLLDAVVRSINEGEVSAGWAADRFGFSIGDLHDWHANLSSAIRD
ncbi:MAG: ImmA/IrrE family metallo-endopeptidase [Gammaproteobacteria bacterium]|nr:ImmA/IrrE family metallo-endopeptidase [Gammaproteobacteria bacterium]